MVGEFVLVCSLPMTNKDSEMICWHLLVMVGGPVLVSQLDAPLQRRQELAAFFARALAAWWILLDQERRIKTNKDEKT